MKKNGSTIISMFAILLAACLCSAEQLTASQILEKTDAVLNAPKDQNLKMKLIITDREGNEKVREINMLQKGSDKRMGRFLTPADQKGIGFLILPGGMVYVYLPAYKKTRRIAARIKNNKFAGTDFTYEDMQAMRYGDKWQAELIKEENKDYILKLTPLSNLESDYSKLVVWVQTDNYYPAKIEYYDQSSNLVKVMNRNHIEKLDKYWISKESEMQDLKTGNRSTMILLEVKFDSGLSDDIFTERFLTR